MPQKNWYANEVLLLVALTVEYFRANEDGFDVGCDNDVVRESCLESLCRTWRVHDQIQGRMSRALQDSSLISLPSCLLGKKY